MLLSSYYIFVKTFFLFPFVHTKCYCKYDLLKKAHCDIVNFVECFDSNKITLKTQKKKN